MSTSHDPFAPKRWLLAFNLPTQQWDSCGHTPEMEATYEREFYDLYQATAPDRETAEALAKAQRRREASLTPRQREILGSLVAEATQEEATHGTDALRQCTEIPPEEHRACRGLIQRGLLVAVVDEPAEKASGSSAHLEVKLTWAGLNGRLRDPLKMQAARRQRHAEAAPPPPASSRRRWRT